jgi:hypothetical protein
MRLIPFAYLFGMAGEMDILGLAFPKNRNYEY